MQCVCLYYFGSAQDIQPFKSAKTTHISQSHGPFLTMNPVLYAIIPVLPLKPGTGSPLVARSPPQIHE